MKYLLDTNVWLELIMDRTHARAVNDLFNLAEPGSLATTLFAIHAIGIYITPKRPERFRVFLNDLARKSVQVLELPADALYEVVKTIEQLGLDFDDAFQYYAAERFQLQLVSLDGHFDRTPRGRITPEQTLAQIRNSA